MTMLQFIKPIIVLTYIDNNSIYHWLCRNYKNSKFIAVQNGIRQVLGMRDIKNIVMISFIVMESMILKSTNNSAVRAMRHTLLDL